MASEASNVLLAQTWDESVDPTGWWMSEKLDGIRCYFTGEEFYSRQGNKFVAPDYFKAGLPSQALDGELWCGHGTFHKTVSIIKKSVNLVPEEWKDVIFVVFDAPNHGGAYEERLKYLKQSLSKAKFASVLGVTKCKGVEHLEECLKRVTELGGEGIMLRKPQSLYERRRSNTLYKAKLWQDEEARVIGYKKGNTNPKHMHLQCELPSGNKFSIGNGFTDYEHSHPPPIGTVVTFKFQEYTTLGTPRFPSFIRIRNDVTWDDVVKNWKDKNKMNKWKDNIEKSSARGKNLFWTTMEQFGGNDDSTKMQEDVNSDNNDEINMMEDTLMQKPPCKYGASCYRTNPEHLQQYSHPKQPQAPQPQAPQPQSPQLKSVGAFDSSENEKLDLISVPKREWLSLLNRLKSLEHTVQLLTDTDNQLKRKLQTTDPQQNKKQKTEY